MLLSDYLNIGNKLDEKGVFDPVLEKDTHLFINLQRLKRTSVSEFQLSYNKIQNYFRKIIKLLDEAKEKSTSDTFYKQAVKLFNFSEVNGICLGYSEGAKGAGFGKGLGHQVIETAYDIVKAGVRDPEFFELLPLFQEKVGADRLSDMIATLILDDIKEYTARINRELGITKENYSHLKFDGVFLENPHKADDILLVPIDILHKLPVAECWEDIELVSAYNSTLRAEINSDVALNWKDYSANEKKEYLREEVFMNPDKCSRIITAYKEESLDEVDPQNDGEYFLSKFEQAFNKKLTEHDEEPKSSDSLGVAHQIIDLFKQWVEFNAGWRTLKNIFSTNREKAIQSIMHIAAMSFLKVYNLDLSCECDEGRGPADFKISRGIDKTVIEVKLSTNPQYLHGYEVQIKEYGKAEQTDNLIYVLIDVGNSGRIKNIRKSQRKCGNKPELIIIDASEKKSASRF